MTATAKRAAAREAEQAALAREDARQARRRRLLGWLLGRSVDRLQRLLRIRTQS